MGRRFYFQPTYELPQLFRRHPTALAEVLAVSFKADLRLYPVGKIMVRRIVEVNRSTHLKFLSYLATKSGDSGSILPILRLERRFDDPMISATGLDSINAFISRKHALRENGSTSSQWA